MPIRSFERPSFSVVKILATTLPSEVGDIVIVVTPLALDVTLDVLRELIVTELVLPMLSLMLLSLLLAPADMVENKVGSVEAFALVATFGLAPPS
jgi:hypothetical protein